jgi:hypothetical protein
MNPWGRKRFRYRTVNFFDNFDEVLITRATSQRHHIEASFKQSWPRRFFSGLALNFSKVVQYRTETPSRMAHVFGLQAHASSGIRYPEKEIDLLLALWKRTLERRS